MNDFIKNMIHESKKNAEYNAHNHVAYMGKLCKKSYLLRD